MILRLTQFPDLTQPEEAHANVGDEVLLNLDQVAAIHTSRITRRTPIVGEDNELVGSIITLSSGRSFPVKESVESIYNALPYPLTRRGLKDSAPATI